MPAAGLGSGDFITAACVVLHLGHYVSCGSHNINVRVGRILEDAWFSPISENPTTNVHNLAKCCIFFYSV